MEYLDGKKWNGKGYNKNNKVIYVLKNGKGNHIKKYDFNGKLKFEGQFLDGKKNGKGKEFYNNDKGTLKFKGEYLNGKKWNGIGYDNKGNKVYTLINGEGYIKYYEDDIDGSLVFEGEYKNGEKNGKGKDYFNGFLIFEGEYLNGKKNGKGKIYDTKREFYKLTEYYDNQYLSYEGEFLNDKKNGKGIEYDYNGLKRYEGEYLNGVINGKGKEIIKIGGEINTYEGEFLNGVKHGKAKVYDYNNNLLFEGEYLNGEKWKGIIREYDNDKLIIEREYNKTIFY